MSAVTPRLFFIDLEVDSVPREKGDPLQSITQIAVCDPSRPENERYFYSHVLPNKQLRKHGKGPVNTQANQGPAQYKFSDVWKDLKEWVNSRLDGNRQAVFVGHNIYKHDWPILSNECTRIQTSVPKHWKTFDTLYLAGTLYGRGGNTQVELCHRLGVEVLKAHNALNDVKMLEGVFKAMIGSAKIEKVLKAALSPPDEHPVKKVAELIRKFVKPILIFYDFETTGLFPDKKHPDRPNPRAVELAAYIPSLDKSWSTLINPDMHIPEEVTGIHGITDDMVADKPKFKAAWLQFEDFINTSVGSTANKIVILCGHNVWGYDDKVRQSESERTNTPIKDYRTLDTLALSRVICKGNGRVVQKLQVWRERLGISENQAHRAGGDVVVNAQVFAKWVEGIPQEALDKAIVSAHPVKGVALLIQEEGSFKLSDYIEDGKEKKNDQGIKREREEENVQKVLPDKTKVKKTKVKEEPETVVKIHDMEEEVQQPAPEPVAVVFNNDEGTIPMDIGEDNEGEFMELVFDAATGVLKG